VSNFDVMDLIEVWKLPAGPDAQADQVLYNLSRRSPEYQLLPWCREENLPVTAYSSIEQGRILSHPAVRGVGERHAATPAQVALAWVIRQRGVCAIPQSGSRGARLGERRRARRRSQPGGSARPRPGLPATAEAALRVTTLSLTATPISFGETFASHFSSSCTSR
jgi:hypothetical protein